MNQVNVIYYAKKWEIVHKFSSKKGKTVLKQSCVVTAYQIGGIYGIC